MGAGVGLGLLTGPGLATAADAGPPATCAEAQTAWARAAAAQVRMSPDDPQSLRDGFVDARDAVDAVRSPTAVAADWQVIRDYLGTMAEAVEGVDGDAAVQAAVKGALGGLDTPAMTQASDRITTYLKGECGASPEPSAAP